MQHRPVVAGIVGQKAFEQRREGGPPRLRRSLSGHRARGPEFRGSFPTVAGVELNQLFPDFVILAPLLALGYILER